MNNEQLLAAISDMLDQKLESSFSDFMDRKFESTLSDLFDQKFDEKLAPLNKRMDSFDERLISINNRLERVESETSALRAGQRDIRKDLREINAKVNETYDIALDAFGTSMENRTWLEKSKLPM